MLVIYGALLGATLVDPHARPIARGNSHVPLAGGGIGRAHSSLLGSYPHVVPEHRARSEKNNFLTMIFFPIIVIPTIPLPFKITPSQAIGARGAEWECTILGQQPNSIQFIEPNFRLQEPTYPRHFRGKKSCNHRPATPRLDQWQRRKRATTTTPIQPDTCHTAKFAPPVRTSCIKGKKKKSATHKECYGAHTHTHDQMPPSATASKNVLPNRANHPLEGMHLCTILPIKTFPKICNNT